jgi:hypothetical protein
MQLRAVRKPRERREPVVALGQPTFYLGTVLWHPLFRCTTGIPADTAHATESSTKLVIHEMTDPFMTGCSSTTFEE